jgi:hypothetical protein
MPAIGIENTAFLVIASEVATIQVPDSGCKAKTIEKYVGRLIGLEAMAISFEAVEKDSVSIINRRLTGASCPERG